MAQRQIVGYGPNGPVYADPAFGTAGGVSPADFATGGSPGAIMPAAQSMPDAMNTPWQTQGPLGGPPPGAPGVPGGSPLDVNNQGAGGGPNPFGFTTNALPGAINNPALATTAFNMNSGYGPNSGTAALNDQYGSNMDAVYLMLNGNAAMGATPEQQLAWEQNYLQQGNTQGGAHITSGQVMNALFTQDPKNPIYQQIYALDNGQAPSPDKVVSRFINLMQAGMQNVAPGFVISAMSNMYAQAGKEWQVLVAQGKFQGSFTDYLISQGMDPASLGMQ